MVATNTRSPVPDKWDASQMPSQKGKVAIVTGANSGIGYETALELARHGALVVLACLNEERGKEAETKLREALAATPEAGKVEFMKLDVGSLDSVHKFSAAFKNTHDRLDLLINNAGVAGGDYALSADGYELPTIWATSR
jgi:NAD(P)-dependent dehydrogenase (short-subunit alcohol dehydrogenase family)